MTGSIRDERDVINRLLGIVHGLIQDGCELGEQLRHSIRIVERGSVGQLQVETARPFGGVQGEVEGRPCLNGRGDFGRDFTGIVVRRRIGNSAVEVEEIEKHLKQRRMAGVALGPEMLQQQFKWKILMRERS